MTAFEMAYDRWLSAPFPEGSELDEIDELHSWLAYVDAMVADAVAGFVSTGHYNGIPEQAERELASVLSASIQSPADAVLRLESYRTYAQLISAVIDAVETETRP